MHGIERFLQDFYKGFELLRVSCEFDSRWGCQTEPAALRLAPFDFLKSAITVRVFCKKTPLSDVFAGKGRSLYF